GRNETGHVVISRTVCHERRGYIGAEIRNYDLGLGDDGARGVAYDADNRASRGLGVQCRRPDSQQHDGDSPTCHETSFGDALEYYFTPDRPVLTGRQNNTFKASWTIR